jgi:uncharacterized membrane protein
VSAAPRGRGLTALAALFAVAFVVVAHAALVDHLPPRVGAALSLVPLALLAAWLLRSSRHRVAVVVAIIAATAGGIAFWDQLVANFPSVFFAEHAGANLLLAFVFGRTLVAGREPLVARFARIVHRTIPPEVESYARKVTLAWTIFFAFLFTLSCVLYLGGWLAAWSVLANIASPILVGVMFVAEYAIRHRVLPNWERVGIMGGVRAFARHFSTAPAGANR